MKRPSDAESGSEPAIETYFSTGIHNARKAKSIRIDFTPFCSTHLNAMRQAAQRAKSTLAL